MNIAFAIYFGIGLVVAILFSIVAYFDSDDSLYHWDMFTSSMILFFLWPIGLYAVISDIVEEKINEHKYNKEHRRKEHE